MQIFLFSNFDEEKKILDTTLCNSEHPETFPGVMWGPTENLGSIGSAVLTHWLQKNRPRDKQSI